MEKTCLLVESIVIFSAFFYLLLVCLTACCRTKKTNYNFYNFYVLSICFLMVLTCMICHAVFLGKIISNNLSYDCSDQFTNELIKQENLNTQKTITYTAVNLVLDIIMILGNILPISIICFKQKCEEKGNAVPTVSNMSSIDEKNKVNNIPKNNFNSKLNNNYQREVIVDNRTPIQEQQINLQNQYNNIPNSNNDFVAPPNIGISPNFVQGVSSNTKI